MPRHDIPPGSPMLVGFTTSLGRGAAHPNCYPRNIWLATTLDNASPFSLCSRLHALHGSHRQHLLAQVVLVLANAAGPFADRLVLANHNVLAVGERRVSMCGWETSQEEIRLTQSYQAVGNRETRPRHLR